MKAQAVPWHWLAGFAALGIALVTLYPDGYQQDAGHRFLFARWAWAHPDLFVGVWTRPLFTLLYSLVAPLGYPTAKTLTVLICLLTAYQTYRLAVALECPRARLVVPLLFLQPSFVMLFSETMTEPLFALIFVVALRLHTAGRVAAGMLVASMLVLARPEGAFLVLLWAVWVSRDRRVADAAWRRATRLPLLAAGTVVWWLSAWIVTGNPRFILHNWPPNWDFTSAVYGHGAAWAYIARLPEIAGPVLAVVFISGFVRLIAERRFAFLTSSFLTLFLVHAVLWTFGWLGSAGYARYLVCVAPATAIITLAGWNDLASRLERGRPVVRRAVTSGVFALSAIACVLYVDMAGFYGRDARAVRELHAWFLAEERPVARLVWSQAYMCILFDRDPWEMPALTGDKAARLEALRASPPGTLVFWDSDLGPKWHGLSADDIAGAGYDRLHERRYELDGWLRESRWIPGVEPRRLDVHVLYKSR